MSKVYTAPQVKPEDRKKSRTVALSDKEVAKLRKLAKKNEMSISAYVSYLLKGV